MNTCYIFDSKTGEYLDTEHAQENPVRPGQYIWPANSTTEPPPKTGDNQAAVWNGQNWLVIPDYRGRTYWSYDRQSHAITQLGVCPDSAWTPEQPTDPESQWSPEQNQWTIPFETLRQRKLAEIRSEATRLNMQLKTTYSTAETDTWLRQEAGAKSLIENPESNTDETRFVRQIAQNRGIAPQTLAAKIIAAAARMRQQEAQIIGTQKQLQDRANAAATIEQLEAITWPGQASKGI